MENQDLQKYLSEAENYLRSVYTEVANSQGFSTEVEKLRIVLELLKEQVVRENSGN